MMRAMATFFGAILPIVTVSSPAASQDVAVDDEGAVSSRLFSRLPALASGSVDDRRLAISEIADLAHLQTNASFAFRVIEHNLVDALRLSLFRADQNQDDEELARELISLLTSIGTEQSLPFVVENITFAGSPDGHASEMPLFGLLVHLGVPAVDAMWQRAVAEDDQAVHRVFAALLVANFGLNGALDWIGAQAAQDRWNDEQRARQQIVRTMIRGR